MISRIAMAKDTYRLILLLIPLLAIISCSGDSTNDIYYVNTHSQKILYNKQFDLKGRYIRFDKGQSVIVLYEYFSNMKSRKGKVYDGGGSAHVYIEIPLPYQLENKVYPVKNKDFRVAYVVTGQPGYYKIYKPSELRGQITILDYQKNKSFKIKLKLLVKRSYKKKPDVVFSKTLLYSTIKF
mgnify:CR=1 FL=1